MSSHTLHTHQNCFNSSHQTQSDKNSDLNSDLNPDLLSDCNFNDENGESEVCQNRCAEIKSSKYAVHFLNCATSQNTFQKPDMENCDVKGILANKVSILPCKTVYVKERILDNAQNCFNSSQPILFMSNTKI